MDDENTQPPTNFRTVLASVGSPLAALTDPLWSDTLQRAECLSVEAGLTLFKNDAPCDTFKILLAGTIRVFQPSDDGREFTLYRMHPGDICFLSLSSLIRQLDFEFNAVSETPITALLIKESDYNVLITTSDQFRNYVLEIATRRILELTLMLKNMNFFSIRTRLAALLFDYFASNQGNPLKITHQKVALELGTSREVVSRLLKELENKGCIKLTRGSIELVSNRALQQFIAA